MKGTSRTAALALGLMLLVGAASAQPREVAKADALFREGRVLMKRSDYEAACPKLEESYRLDPAAGTGINLGDCFEKQGKVASALLAYQAARALLQRGDLRIGPVEKEISALDKRAPRLTIKLAPGAPRGTKVKRDGRRLDRDKLGTSAIANPGEHELVVNAPGRQPSRISVTLVEGETRTVTLGAGERSEDTEISSTSASATGEQPAEGKTVGKAQPSDGSTQRTLGYVLGGVGVASLAVGGIFWGLAKAVPKDCDNMSASDCETRTNDEQSKLDAATGAGIVGAAALAGGIALVLLAPEQVSTSSRVRVGPTLTRTGYGLSLGGTW